MQLYSESIPIAICEILIGKDNKSRLIVESNVNISFVEFVIKRTLKVTSIH